MVKNYMEVIVDTFLPSVLNQYKDICKCERCIDDIKAFALNRLKPLYFVSDKGSIYSKLNELQIQFRTDVTQELVKAIDAVSKNNHHDK